MIIIYYQEFINVYIIMSHKLLIPKEKEQEIITKLAGTWKRPLFQYWDEYRNDYIIAKRSESTIANTQAALRFFLLYSELISIESWLEPRKVQDEFQRLKKERNWSEGTHNSYRKNISSYFNRLVGMNHIAKNPIDNVVMPLPNLVKDQLSISNINIKKLFKFLDNTPHWINYMQRFRDRLFFSLLSGTGARPIELLNLNLDSFSSKRDSIAIKTAKWSGKTRYFPLDYKTQELVSMYIREVAISGYDKALNHSFF